MQIEGNQTQNAVFSALTSKTTPDQLPNDQVLGKDDFLRLLVTQLSYQDPLEPLKNEEFIAQTAQFSTLEQVQALNKTLLDQIALQRTIADAMAVQYVGKTVEAPGSRLVLAQGQPASLAAKLAYGDSPVWLSEGKVQFDIFDTTGELVSTIHLDAVHDNIARAQWEGHDLNGQPLPEGIYTYEVHAVDDLGEPVEATPIMSGTVSGIVYEDGETLLSVNGQNISPKGIFGVGGF